ncbi:MAG: PQQ-dependent sugar dehydrogenase [Planctomycetota bacterium]
MTRFMLLVMVSVVLASPSWAQQFPAGNPINATIPKTSFTVELEEVVTIPNSAGTFPRVGSLVAGGAPGMAYVVDQRGPIYRFDPGDANPIPELFLDVSGVGATNFLDGFQRGLRGLAFHPDFNNPGTDGFRKFYTSQSRIAFSGSPVGDPNIFWSPQSPDHDSVVAEWSVDATGAVDVNSYRELMYIGQPLDDHNVGQLSFNTSVQPGDPDYGKLYIPLGDGGGVQDPNNLAQNITINPPSNPTGYPHGSILRIDPIASGNDPYTIPSDNPFAGQANIIQEVWAYGLRNPHRISWDEVTGKMLIADIGQNNIEEINLGSAGANYGWDGREGTFQSTFNSNVVSALSPTHPSDAFTYPVAQYDHDPDNNNNIEGLWAIAGGQVYRGDNVPQLDGMYIFGDFAVNDGPVYAVHVDELVQRDDFTNLGDLNDGLLAPIVELSLTQDGQPTTMLDIIREASGVPGLNRTDIRFGVGPNNEVYIVNKRDGVVRRIAVVNGFLDCDFTDDGACDGTDIDLLIEEIAAGTDDPAFDLTGDGLVTVADRDAWLTEAGARNLPSGNAYLVGDANLDGVVDGQDFIAWNNSKFTTVAAWTAGDFTADGLVDGQDFIAWNNNKFTSADAIAVPEPASSSLWLMTIVAIRLMTTRKTSRRRWSKGRRLKVA